MWIYSQNLFVLYMFDDFTLDTYVFCILYYFATFHLCLFVYYSLLDYRCLCIYARYGCEKMHEHKCEVYKIFQR